MGISVAVCGQGEWSTKIESSLINHVNLAKYGARELLANPEATPVREDIVWIASRIEFQFELLELLIEKKFTGKVIIEKPYFISKEQRRRLCEMSKLIKNQIFLSQVWRFSELWSLFYTDFISRNDSFCIEAKRVGKRTRSEFSPPFDWIPHDLYLVADLLSGLNLDYSIEEVTYGNDGSSIKSKISVQKGSSISLIAGYSEDRRSIWKIRFGKGDQVILNFANQTMFRNSKLVYAYQNSSTTNKLPIQRFVDYVMGAPYDENYDLNLRLNGDVLLRSSNEN